MKPYILLIDDEEDYNSYYRIVAEKVRWMTHDKIEVEYLAPVKNLAESKSRVLAKVAAKWREGCVLVGLVIDVFDVEAHKPFAGVELVEDLRREEGMKKGFVKIVLVTTKGHIESVPPNKADEVLPRLYDMAIDEAALRLICIFGLHGFVKVPPQSTFEEPIYHERSKVSIVIVDDDLKADSYLRLVGENVEQLTGGEVVVHPIVGVELHSAASRVLSVVERAIGDGYVLGGIVIDVYDKEAKKPLGGVELLKTLRGMRGFSRDALCKIVLATIRDHITLADVPEADDVIVRSVGGSIREVAIRLLGDLNLSEYLTLKTRNII